MATIAYGLKLVRSDIYTIGMTTADVDAVIGGVTYRCNPGLQQSDVETSLGLAVANGEITTLNDGTLISELDVLHRLWDGAMFELIKYDFLDPLAGQTGIIAGYIGDIRGVGTNTLVIELRGLTQPLQLPIGLQTSKSCQHRLENCGYNLDGDGTYIGTISHVTSRTLFRVEEFARPADYFGAGKVKFNDGACAGAELIVLSYTADGWFTVQNGLFADLQVGDQVTAKRGCRKTISQCKIIRGHVLDFNGFPQKPSMLNYTRGGNENAV